MLDYKILNESVDLSGFCCLNEDNSGVNDFIHNPDEALKYQNEKMGVSYLFYWRNWIVGYCTLSMNSIPNDQIPGTEELEWFGKKRPPVLLIGQLGVDNKFRHKRVGQIICDFVAGFAEEISLQIGCRYVALHADIDKKGFYIKCDFEEVSEPKNGSVFMVRRLVKPEI